MNMVKKILQNKYIPWIVLGLEYFFIILLNYYVQWRCLDSDMASEMVLANLLNKEGAIISKNWYYSTEVRVFCEQIWFQFGLLLFPNNWRIARLIGHSINLALLIGSFIFLLYSTSIKEKGLWIAMVLLMPFDFWYLFYITFSGFYICHTIALFVMLGLLLRYINNNRKVYLLLLFIFGIIFGLNGIKVLMYFTVPCLLTLIIIAVYKYVMNNSTDIFQSLMISALISSLSTFIGVFIYLFVICKVYTCSPPLDLYWGNININNILLVIGNYLQSLGFLNNDYFVTEIKILSFNGILGIFGLINIIIFIFALCTMLRNKYFSTLIDKLLFVFIISAYLSGICIFSLTKEPSNGSYWLPFIPFSFVIIELFTENIKEHNCNNGFIKMGILTSFIICSFINTTWYLNNNPRSHENLHNVAQWLQENGCKKVVAEFWEGNALTEYSNGSIEAFVINDFEYPSIYELLQTKDHKNAPLEKNTYVVIPEKYKTKKDLSYYDDNAILSKDYYELLIYKIK